MAISQTGGPQAGWMPRASCPPRPDLAVALITKEQIRKMSTASSVVQNLRQERKDHVLSEEVWDASKGGLTTKVL